jgi:hypothetical protein
MIDDDLNLHFRSYGKPADRIFVSGVSRRTRRRKHIKKIPNLQKK